MSLPWLAINPRLQNGVELMNALSQTKFALLLKHIIESRTADEKFTADERQKLQTSLKLDENQLQLLILSLVHVWKQSSKVILKPTVLHKQLTTVLKLDVEKADDFVKLWTSETKNDFDLENAKRLDNVAWELDLHSAAACCDKEAVYSARVQLGLSDLISDEKDNVVLVLDEDELLHLYNTLENVQIKLDSIQ